MSPSDLRLLQGTLDLLVLKALAVGPRHGYGVARWIAETTSGALEIEEGALYTALHRMEKRRLLRADWGLSEQNRRARFYALTGAGRSKLEDEARSWDRYVEAMSAVLDARALPESSS